MTSSPSRAVRIGAWTLCALAVLFVVARILVHPWPASDPVHSRWLTIEALLEDKSFAIGYRVEEDGGYRDVGRVTTLPTVDVMLDPETGTFYSSKPPFLQALYAPLVKVIASLQGVEHVSLARAELMRWLLLLVHALPFALGLAWLTQWWLGRERPAVALVLVGIAGFGTFLTTFSNALSNHVPASFATLFALVGVMRVVAGERQWLWFAMAGLAAGFAAALEYPAATLVVATLVVLARTDLKRTMAVALPAALLPLLLSHALDFIVFGEPLFFFRRGAEWFRYPGSYWTAATGLDRGERSLGTYALHFLIGHHGAFVLTPLFGVALVGALARLSWREGPLGSLSSLAAAVALVLLPVAAGEWLDVNRVIFVLLAAPSLLVCVFVAGRAEATADLTASRLLLACTLPTLAFYLDYTQNYGGITSGPRWLLWLTPLWLLAVAPFVRWAVERRWRPVLLAGLVVVSVASALAPGANPYRHPWTYRLYLAAFGDGEAHGS